MSDLVISGLTIERYAKYFTEANILRQKWELSKGTLDIENDMLVILENYGQDVAVYTEDGEINYHACGMICEWQEIINNDPKMLIKFSQLSAEIMSQPMYGNAEESAGLFFEGINLDMYAQICAKMQGVEENALPGFLSGFCIYGIEHWKTIRESFNSAMEADTSMQLMTRFRRLFVKYYPSHIETH
ncbi:MAG: hypothetical protein GY754_38135 [bacterium]|nr:hypothetical protein [bacterium]